MTAVITKEGLDAWMLRPEWLLAAARVRVAIALEFPELHEERLAQMRRAALYEQVAREVVA